MAPPPLTLRLINLATLLAEEHPATRAPPPGALAGGGGGGGWTEAQLRAHYRGGGQAGGAAGGLLPPPGPGAPPPGTVAAAAGGSAASYRAAAAAWGIPPRPAGLFPAADPLLSTLAATPDAWPFEKLLPGDVILHAAPAVSWASGNAAAAAGVDLRLFGVPHPTPGSPFPHGAVRGAVRFGEGASIGAGHWLPVHGGAIETVLDESTAEAGKVGVSHLVSTIDIHFKIGKRVFWVWPVPLHTTLEVEARVEKVAGVKITVTGSIRDPATGAELASCVAVLADLVALRRAGV